MCKKSLVLWYSIVAVQYCGLRIRCKVILGKQKLTEPALRLTCNYHHRLRTIIEEEVDIWL